MLPSSSEKMSDTSTSSTSSIADASEVYEVVVGICAMEKKSLSRPMTEILNRLRAFEYIHPVVFPQEDILTKPVEEWPLCDCLISFHSKGFPLDKAVAYSELRRPFLINSLNLQYELQDRRKVYSILQRAGIELPRFAVLNRDNPNEESRLMESDDSIEINGVVFNKPFVEKPVSAEDHNVYIYYPSSAGGGSQRLFRKIGSRSSVYSPESRVRKVGSFMYEDFMPTDGTDVKVYTVGPDYAHAEARKSPALDGKVERDLDGKEVRYPVILSNAEKLIARKVCLAFKQLVCGFDLLRANGKSFVCDVNGFSFVKNSSKYYDDCAQILGNMILRELSPTLHIPWSMPFQLDDPPFVPTSFGKMMELRCVCAVIRHGDRTPKQKMKMEVRHPRFFETFGRHGGWSLGHIKLKHPKQLQEILDIARDLLNDPEWRSPQLEQLRAVLEMYGHFSGINRKVQLKYRPGGLAQDSGSEDMYQENMEPCLILILKWGGELTPAGRVQAEELGRVFRCMYPGGHGQYSAQGLGLLRLHSTFRHDLKIYASDEGRVQMTAAAFAKGLLALEGELTPILVQMVKSAHTNGLLDNDSEESSKCQTLAKVRLHEMLQQDRVLTPEDRARLNPTNELSICSALDLIGNPVEACRTIHRLMLQLIGIVNQKMHDPRFKDGSLYQGETWELMHSRWGKLERDFIRRDGKFHISKIPDIYDCIKYDYQHNQHALQFTESQTLYVLGKAMADIVIPQEYGLTAQEKLTIGQGICTPLLRKLKADLQRDAETADEDESVNRLHPHYSTGVSSPGRHVRTRLYFTSESHIHSLVSILRYGGLVDEAEDPQWKRAMEYVSAVSEHSYLTQLVIMSYEDTTKDPTSNDRFHVEIHFSPGVNCCVDKDLPPGPGFHTHSRDSKSSLDSSGERSPREDQDNLDCSSNQPLKNPSVDAEIREACAQLLAKGIPIKDSHELMNHQTIPEGKCSEEPPNQVLPERRGSEASSMRRDTEGRKTSERRPGVPYRHSLSAIVHRSSDYKVLMRAYPEKSTGGDRRLLRHSVGSPQAQCPYPFSTAVISGFSPPSLLPESSHCAPLDSRPIAVVGPCGGVPEIRPLETLHNALSLKELDEFLERLSGRSRSNSIHGFNSPMDYIHPCYQTSTTEGILLPHERWIIMCSWLLASKCKQYMPRA